MLIKNAKNIIIIILVFIVFFQRCNKKENIVNNTVFDTIYAPSEIKNNYITKYKSKKQDTVFIFKEKVDTLRIYNFEKSNDSEKIEKFADAIAVRQYKDTFFNKKDNLKIIVFNEVEGKLLKTHAESFVGERKPSFALYAGAGTYSSFNNLNFKFNIGFQNKKEDILFLSYDPFTKTGFIDYNIKIKLK